MNLESERLEKMINFLPSRDSTDLGELLRPKACKLAEARFLGTTLDALNGETPIQYRGVWKGATWSTALVKGQDRGNKTALIIRSTQPELEGMIIRDDNVCMRYMRADCTYPSMDNYILAIDSEGLALAKLAKKLGFPRFGLDDPIFGLFRPVFEELGIKVGPHFFSNIELFTRYIHSL